jgi:glycosyltransferase involved in cell wall biosynthesis
MKVGFISVSHNFYGDTQNSVDVAIGRYTKHTVYGMKNAFTEADQLTLITNQESEGTWDQAFFQIVKPFSKSKSIGIKLWNYLRKARFDVVHFQHEFFIYGGPLNSILITLALLFHKHAKKVVTAHHVVDMRKIDKKFITDNNYSYPVWLVRLAMGVSYALLLACCDRVVVHETASKNILMANWSWLFGDLYRDIVVINHGISTREKSDRMASRSQLKLIDDYMYVLFFGYVSRHKGVDLLLDGVKILQQQGKKISVIIAGGEHPKLATEKDYQGFYAGLQSKAAALQGACWYGFAQEDALPVLFSAADIAAFPYTTRNAASGSVTDSISFGLPFILSNKFADIEDYQHLTFDITPQALADKLDSAIAERDQMQQEVLNWRKQYNWDNIGQLNMNLYKSLI